MSESNGLNGFYNRITSLLSRIHSNINTINISSIGLRRNTLSSSRLNPSIIENSHPLESQQTREESPQRGQSYSLLGSLYGSQRTQTYSHIHRHSTHYPLLLGSYNWSLSRDNRFVTHLNNNNSIEREKDRNVLSAILSIIVIATLATALAQPKWFSISGGVCNRKYIGLQEFFYVSTFNNYQLNINKAVNPESETAKDKSSSTQSHEIIYYGMNGDLKNCVTPEIVTLQRTIIGLSFFAIMFNMIQFFFDTLGVNKKWLNAIRQHALGNILGVLICVVIIGVSYLVSNLLEKEQRRLIKEKHDSALEQSHHIEVKFELSYYLVTLSGLLAIIAAASNLLKRPQNYYIEASDSFWSEDIDANSTPIDDEIPSSVATSPNWHSNGTTHTMNLTIPSPQSSSMPPPPPYSP